MPNTMELLGSLESIRTVRCVMIPLTYENRSAPAPGPVPVCLVNHQPYSKRVDSTVDVQGLKQNPRMFSYRELAHFQKRIRRDLRLRIVHRESGDVKHQRTVSTKQIHIDQPWKHEIRKRKIEVERDQLRNNNCIVPASTG